MITDHNEYVPTVIKETWSRQTNKQAKVIQEVVLAEVSQVNHSVMNKKRDQMQFSLKKD